MANKEKREWLAHFIDSNFGTGTAAYYRIGEDLESYAIELNPDVETKKNIIGTRSINIKGYDTQASVDSFYAYEGDALYAALEEIVKNEDTTGLETTVVDVRLDESLDITWARMSTVLVVPQSIGGDTDGIQIPFDIYYKGDYTDVTSKASIVNGVLVISA